MLDHIQIDDQDFPLYTEDNRRSPWSTVQRGERVEWERRFGFLGGAGSYVQRSQDDYLILRNMDAQTFPYLRLTPGRTNISLTGLGATPNHPVYTFVEQDGSGNNYCYVLNGQYAWKIDLSDNSTGTRQDFGAGAVCGRPTLFQEEWYVPLGESVDYVKLETVAVGNDANADTWTTIAEKAKHFTVVQRTQQEMLVRGVKAFSVLNIIDLSSDGSTWQADNFELPAVSWITDMHTAGNEMMIGTSEGVFMMTPEGRAVNIFKSPALAASGKDSAAEFIGANSALFGPAFYWPHTSGLHRFIGQSLQRQIDISADPHWVNRTLDSFAFFTVATAGWRSVAAGVGSWIYATYFTDLWAGEIQEDYSVRWHGVVWRDSNLIRCSITEGDGVSDQPILWVAATDQSIMRFDLQQDGSLRTDLGDPHGLASTTHQAWFPEVRGPRSRPFQLRVMWVELEGDVGAQQPVQLAAHMDGATTSTDVGATVTSTGYTERRATVGTSDTAQFLIPTVKVVTGASYDTNDDLRIRALGLWGLTSQVYRAVIDLRGKTLAEKGSQWDSRGALKVLRDMTNGEAKTIIEPETEESFSGYVEGLDEQFTPDGPIVSVLIERWDWYGA